MKTTDILTVVLLAVVIVPIIATMVPTGSVHFMTITGNSMEPTVTSNDIIVVTPSNNLEVGDIISYRRQVDQHQVIVTHRITEIVEGGYRTKGDAHSRSDNYVVAHEDVVGVMRFKIPFLGALIHFAGTKIGYVTLVLVPAITIIAIEIRKIIGYRRSGE